jgi:hypothetical protein
MSKTSSPTPFEPGRLHGGIAPLVVVIATNLATAHSTGQYLAGLAALPSRSPTTPSSTGGRQRTPDGRG